MLVGLVLDRGDAGALLGAGEDHRRAVGLERLRIGRVDRLEVVAVDLLHVPVAGRGARRQRGGVPLVHGRAALAEPVDVDDRDQVVEAGVAGLLEGLPHRALGELGVAAEHPDAEVGALEPLAGERDADRDRQALAERAGGDVDPGDLRRRVALQARAELAEGEQLLVVDRAGHLVHAVEQRRGVALGEDEVVVGRVLGRREVVAQVARRAGPPSGRRPTSRRSGGRSRRRRRRGRSRRAAAGRARAAARDSRPDRLSPAPRGREAIRSRPFARSESALVRRSPPGR